MFFFSLFAGFWSIAVTAVITNGCLNGAVPLFFEASMEETYPAPEATILT